jgi:hypothetical protein
MQWIECDECDNWRRIDNVRTPAGLVQPPCYVCGAPGWLESLETGAPIEFFEYITLSNYFEEGNVK